jgi:PadR family transcriptional regulator PadR
MGQARRADIRDNLTLELRRGALVLAVLAALQEEQYGYSLKTYLAGKDVDIDEGTLYPLLRRLEAQSLLDSRWALGENRPRRYYKLNAQGMRTLRELKGEWRQIAGALDKLLRHAGDGDERKRA